MLVERHVRAREELAPGHMHRRRNPVLKWIVAGAAKHIAPRLCIFQARAMNKLNRRCCRTSLRAVRARTRDAQAACTSCI